jgi:hypothetical protein
MSTKPTPPAIPPCTWLSTIIGLMPTTPAINGAGGVAKLRGLRIESMLYGTRGVRDISLAIAAQTVWRTL